MQAEHVYTGRVHSDNRGRLHMVDCKHRTGLMPQMPHCALLGGVLHEFCNNQREHTSLDEFSEAYNKL